MRKAAFCAIFILIAWLPQTDAKPAEDSATPNITLISPRPGQTVRPGETITIELQPDSTLSTGKMLLMATPARHMRPSMHQISGPPFRTTVTIPSEASGKLSLVVFLIDESNGEYAGEAEINLVVIPTETPKKIQVSDSLFILEPPNPDGSFSENVGFRKIEVYGIYTEQLTRDLTPAVLGTTYVSSDTDIVNVTKDGVLEPVAPGLTYITVKYKNLSEFVEVVVDDEAGNIPRAADRTKDVDIQLGKFVWSAEDDGILLKQKVTITNKTDLPLSWLSLALDGLPKNVHLIDDCGETETLPPLGSPIYDVLPSRKPFLLPGESVAVIIKFLPAENLPITYNPRVISGLQP